MSLTEFLTDTLLTFACSVVNGPFLRIKPADEKFRIAFFFALNHTFGGSSRKHSCPSQSSAIWATNKRTVWFFQSLGG